MNQALSDAARSAQDSNYLLFRRTSSAFTAVGQEIREIIDPKYPAYKMYEYVTIGRSS